LYDNQTLAEAGIKDSDVLRLIPEFTDGCFLPHTKVLTSLHETNIIETLERIKNLEDEISELKKGIDERIYSLSYSVTQQVEQKVEQISEQVKNVREKLDETRRVQGIEVDDDDAYYRIRPHLESIISVCDRMKEFLRIVPNDDLRKAFIMSRRELKDLLENWGTNQAILSHKLKGQENNPSACMSIILQHIFSENSMGERLGKYLGELKANNNQDWFRRIDNLLQDINVTVFIIEEEKSLAEQGLDYLLTESAVYISPLESPLEQKYGIVERVSTHPIIYQNPFKSKPDVLLKGEVRLK